jgi:ABC-type sugar transport system ATPase subunit
VAESGARVQLIEGLSRGVDAASREVLYSRLRDLAGRSGDVAVILLAWSEFDDIEALADRALILRNGSVSEELRAGQLSREEVESAIYR